MEKIQILFCDEELVVCVKPAGVLSQQGANGETTMLTLLEQQTNRPVLPVHRLDRETQGLMVYAFTTKAAAELTRQIQLSEFKKEYLAVVQGVNEKNTDKLTDLLFYDRKRNKSYVVRRERKGVKKAELEYKVLDTKDRKSLMQVKLHTGRTHQIRVQFASRGMPVVGDRRYGAARSDTLALASCRVSFKHPATGITMKYSYIPEQFCEFNSIQLSDWT